MLQRLNCPHLEEVPGGRRLSGCAYPSFAHGAHLPGEEPHLECARLREPCAGEECSFYEQTLYLCPDCLAEMTASFLVNRDNSDLFCPRCESSFPCGGMQNAYLDAVRKLKTADDDAIRIIGEREDEIAFLRRKVEIIAAAARAEHFE